MKGRKRGRQKIWYELGICSPNILLEKYVILIHLSGTFLKTIESFFFYFQGWSCNCGWFEIQARPRELPETQSLRCSLTSWKAVTSRHLHHLHSHFCPYSWCIFKHFDDVFIFYILLLLVFLSHFHQIIPDCKLSRYLKGFHSFNFTFHVHKLDSFAVIIVCFYFTNYRSTWTILAFLISTFTF